jgi:tetratricopeptide (TPR) repeat protein
MATKETLCDVAVDLFGEGKIDEAIAMYKEALGLDPDYVDALHGLALAYSSKENYEDAVAVGRRICQIAPDDVLAQVSLSLFLQRQGRIAEADSATTRGLMESACPPKEEDGEST